MFENMRVFEVGGCVRDDIMGLDSKDVDFACEVDNFASMRKELVRNGFEIFMENEDCLTIRAKVPRDNPLFERTTVADFVMCRSDGPTKDGRRPMFVEPGTIMDDLARRDFTCNAIARDPLTGDILDPFGGREDIASKTLNFVGNPFTRVTEDGLRVLRGFRFSVTKGFKLSPVTRNVLFSPLSTMMLERVTVERIREEINKMLMADTLASLEIFSAMSDEMRAAIFRDGLRLESTLKK